MDLSRLLFPKTIAVIGGKPAAEVIRQNDRLGFAGAIYPVHPVHDRVVGRTAFDDLDDLPMSPDAVFLAVNRHATIENVARLAALGAGGVVCYASGFAEVDQHGALLQSDLCAAAGTMPVLGPNCYGILNYLDGAALWPDQHGGRRVAKGVAIITQSGNIGCNLTMQRRGLPIAFLGTLGNQAMVGLSDMIAALSEDPRITVIGLHIEGIDDAQRFAAAVALARSHGIRVVAIKTGVSQRGAALAISHTASLAGADSVADSYLHRIGVARVHTLPELLETLKLLHVHGDLGGSNIVSMSCSGGEAALLADRAEPTKLQLRAFTASERDAVAATVPDLVTVSNPFDYHTFLWGNRERLALTFAAVMRANFALTVLILDFPRGDRCADGDWWAAALALHDASRATDRPAAIVATLAECLPEEYAERLMQMNLAPLFGLDEALTAIGVAASASTPGPPPLTTALRDGTTRTLDEWDAKCRLAVHGVSIPLGRTARTAFGLTAPRFPAVVKSLGVAHKTEHGAVRLGLADQAAFEAAAQALEPLGFGLLAEEMVVGVAEIIVGMARDVVLGPYLLLGSGGVLAELVSDRAVLMLPASRAEITTALAGLSVARLVEGYRGRSAGNVAAAIDTVLAIQRFILANLDTLIELDVNPLIITETRAVAADALIRMTEPP